MYPYMNEDAAFERLKDLPVSGPVGRVLQERHAVGLQVREVTAGYPIKQEENEDVRVSPSGQLLTGDHNLVNLQVKLYYTVKDSPQDIERYVLLGDRVDALAHLRPAVTHLDRAILFEPHDGLGDLLEPVAQP